MSKAKFVQSASNNGSLFLTALDVQILTGWIVHSKQIAALRKLGIAFFVNPATGRPIVPLKAIEGERTQQTSLAWKSNAIGA